jgi:uncharacterized protein YjbI with pentapeptide repeats
MANQEHVEILKKGVVKWNEWRFTVGTPVDLSGADLHDIDVLGANFYRCDLSHSNLRNVKLRGTSLGGANLSRADLTDANLNAADLGGANLSEAKLARASVRYGASRPLQLI